MNDLRKRLGIDDWLEIVKEDRVCNGAYISIAQYMYLLEKNMNDSIKKLNLLISDLKINEKAEEQDGKSYFNTQLFAIRVKEILEILERTDK